MATRYKVSGPVNRFVDFIAMLAGRAIYIAIAWSIYPVLELVRREL